MLRQDFDTAQYLLPAMVWLLHSYPETPTRILYHKVIATVSFSAQPFHVEFSQRRLASYSATQLLTLNCTYSHQSKRNQKTLSAAL